MQRNLSPPGWENANVSVNCSDSESWGDWGSRVGLDKCVFLNNLETRAWLFHLQPGFSHLIFLSTACPVYQRRVTHLAVQEVNACSVAVLTAECRGWFSSTVPKFTAPNFSCVLRACGEQEHLGNVRLQLFPKTNCNLP